MKIETDLRMAINAAARAQKPLSYEEREKAEQAAIAALLPKKKAEIKKARELRKEANALEDKRIKLNKEVNAILEPMGLRFDDREGKTFEIPGNENAKVAFVKAGGVLPPSERRKWSADEVIRRLASAKPEQRDAILSEYGIDWS